MQNPVNLDVNLPVSLEEADFFTKDPFVIFEIENFVNEDFYDELVKDVKSRQEFDRVFKAKGNKKKFSLGGHNIEQAEDTPFTNFVRFFLSQRFFDWFAKTHLPHFKSDGEPHYVYNKNSDDFKKLKQEKKDAGVAASFYNTEVHYSSIEEGGFIPPHTDAPKKRLSLVYYLPSDPVSKEMEENLGTVFYKSKPKMEPWRRFKSGLIDKKETKAFLAEHDVARTTTFQRNKVAGFIKSDVSWHAVSPNQYDYDRRAIVINIVEM